MQKTCAFSWNRVETKLACHHAGKVCDLERVVQHVLAIRSAVAQTAERLDKLGVHIVDAGIEGSLIACFLHTLVHELLGFREHLFDTCGMNTSVSNQVLHRDTTDFASNGVEA